MTAVAHPYRFVLSAIIGVVVVSSARVRRETDRYQYGVILDAGSSKTGVHVYRWDPDNLPTKTAHLAEMEVTGTSKVRPGISAYASNPSDVRSGLKTLIDSAASVVPEELHSNTPIYLKATAGMRLLESDDVEAVFDQINALLLDSSQNPFKFKRGWAKVISGEEEGIFGWITVNFLTGLFDSDGDQKPFGALDLGGASTQITFNPDGQIFANFFPLSIANKQYDMYTNSFLKFGLDQFRLQLYQHLYVQATDKNAFIVNPCDLAGYNTTRDIGDNRTAKIQGTGNPNQECRVLVRQLLGLDDSCYTEPCSIVGTYQPPVADTVFYGTAGLYYTASAIGAVNGDGGFTSIANFQSKIDQFCGLSYDQALDVAGDFAHNYCMSGHYLTALLGDGYKIDTTADDKVFIVHKINGVETGWTLGSMLYELYLLNIKFSVSATSHVTATPISVLLMAAILSQLI